MQLEGGGLGRVLPPRWEEAGSLEGICVWGGEGGAEPGMNSISPLFPHLYNWGPSYYFEEWP